jgi:uncharacterized coiled-coil protein SlyX
MVKKPKEPTLLDAVVEVIITHPHETITIVEMMRQLPKDTNKHTVQNYAAKALRRAEMIRPTASGLPKVYKILKREPLTEPPWAHKPKPKEPPAEESKKQEPKTEISDAELGRAVFDAMEELKRSFQELTQQYSDQQIRMDALKTAHQRDLKTLNRKITEQNGMISAMRDRVKGRTHKLEDVVNIKGR